MAGTYLRMRRSVCIGWANRRGYDMEWDTSRLSLMIFAMGFDIFLGRITIEDSLCIAKECGIPAVDVMNVPENRVGDYVSAVRSTGTEIYCYIAMISFFQTESKVVRAIEKELHTAQRLGAKLLMIVPGGAPEIKWARRRPRDEIMDRLTWGYQKAADLSRGTDIKVCFETTPHESLHLSGNADCQEMLNRVPQLGLVLDTANMLPHGDTTMDAYTLLKERIVYVHLKDVALIQRRSLNSTQERTADGRIMECTVWGQGEIPIQHLYETMLNDSYTGRFAIEYVPPKIKKRQRADHVQQLRYYLNC